MTNTEGLIMSGRDLRNFVVQHRTDQTDSIVRRVMDGVRSNKYKPVNYDELRQIAAQKKFKGQEQLVKVKKIEEASRHSKEQQVIQAHKAAWRKEFNKLNSQRKKLQAEIDVHMRDNTDDDDLFLLYRELEDHETQVSSDLQEFKTNTVEPVWELREDLQYWLAQYQSSRGAIEGEHPSIVQEQIKQVQSQQQGLLNTLTNQQAVLEQELQTADLPSQHSIDVRKLPQIETGIPEEAFDLECPDFTLKASVLQEFILVDNKYTEKMIELNQQYGNVLSSATGEWSDDDHLTFLYVVDQYPYDVPNRRTLYIDRLKKHLPHKSRQNIVDHETWYSTRRHLTERQRALIHDWHRDRRELFNRARATFHEACLAAAAAQAKQNHQEKQSAVCNHLYEKLRIWREQKFELLQLEMERAEAERKILEEERRLEDEKEKKRRASDKQKIIAHHATIAAKQRQAQEEQERRMEQLRKILQEQAERDKERVAFREVEYEKKRESLKQKQRNKEEIQAEKEQILEAIRKQVRPHVESDLLRLWSDTQAVKQHNKRGEEYINIQQPLYRISGYTQSQLAQDPRYKLETELREAGLIQNEYARRLIAAQAPPPKPQQPSSVFK